MTESPVALDHVLHVLAPSGGAQLQALRHLWVDVGCRLRDPEGHARTWRTGHVGARSVRTAKSLWMASTLVTERPALTGPLLTAGPRRLLNAEP